MSGHIPLFSSQTRARRLVVVAGLPGAGKTTLLRRLPCGPGLRALDAEDMARRLAGVPVPYQLLRPLVHGLHLVRVAALSWSTTADLVTTDPMTSAARRRLLRAVAVASGRRLVVVLLASTPEQAREGQRARGRHLGERRMRRHEQRYRDLDERFADVVVSRGAAAHARTLEDLLADTTTAPPATQTPLVARAA